MSQSHREAQSDEQSNGMDRGRGRDRGAEAMSMNYMSGAVPHQQGKRGKWEQKEDTMGSGWFSLPWIYHCDLSSVLGSREEREGKETWFWQEEVVIGFQWDVCHQRECI